MASIRKDLVGVTIIRDFAGQYYILHAGDEVPDGLTVGRHLLSTGGAPKAIKPVENAVPAKAGRGSSADAWKAYAEAAIADRGLHIDIPDDATRTDIIEALQEAQIPTE